MPATPGGKETAGPSFELYLPVMVPPEPRNRWRMLFEELDQVIAAAGQLGKAARDPASAVRRLAQIADTLGIMKRSLQVAARSDA